MRTHSWCAISSSGRWYHGKTVMMDMLSEQTHDDKEQGAWAPFLKSADKDKQGATDARHDEQQRELSIKATPVSLVLPASSGKSHLLNIIDCPGHVCFSDECTAGLRRRRGVTKLCRRWLDDELRALSRQAGREGTAIVLCITKVDRLIVELKLPPTRTKSFSTLLKTQMLCSHRVVRLAYCRALVPSSVMLYFLPRSRVVFTLGSFAQLYANRQGHSRSAQIGEGRCARASGATFKASTTII